MPDAAERRAAIVYNPTKVDIVSLRAEVAEAEREFSWSPSLWASTTIDDPGEGVTRQLLDEGPSVVIAAGGDGTVSAVAQALRHTDVALGILPSGTTNLFARALGLPMGSTRKALRATFGGAVRSVDVGRVELVLESGEQVSRAFLVMAGMGVDAQMVVNTSTRGKSTLGWMGYIAAILESFRRNRQFELGYSLDCQPQRSGEAHTLVIGNAGVLPAGMRMIPGALVDDGELDIVVLRPRGPVAWSQALGWFVNTNFPALPRPARVRAKANGAEPVTNASVQHSRASSLSALLPIAQDFEVDGEYIGRVLSVDAWVEPGALLVRGGSAGTRGAGSSAARGGERGQQHRHWRARRLRRSVPDAATAETAARQP